MAQYFTYVIKNTNKGKFMVVRRHGLTDSVASCYAYHDTFEAAYDQARGFGFGAEPIDETRHH